MIDERHPPIKPRRVQFDWAEMPLHWIPGKPFPTHMINVLNLLLPAGERWFVHVYKQALPLIKDERLYRETKGFMGQEAVHSRAHSPVFEHLTAHGLDPAPASDRIEWLFGRLLGDQPPWPLRLMPKKTWLMWRVGLIAAIEHYTAILGQWVLDAKALDDAKANPVMVDLLRWHGAEEVEHRSVAFDVYQHLSGNYLRRVICMLVASAGLFIAFSRGLRFLLTEDPELAQQAKRRNKKVKGRYRDWFHSARLGLLPSPLYVVWQVPRYTRPGYHPSTECSTQKAIDYLRTSPAAKAAGYDPY